MTFNARGGAATTALPRFGGDTQYTTTYAYDARNRPVLTTLPDSATTSAVYGLNFTLGYNPEGDLTATSRSATGLVSYLTEYLGATPIVTSTTRDIDGRSEIVVDAVGNGWLTQYDSLGRVISKSDPDSGVDVNEYNDAGELTANINSLGQRTELTYDLLGRILTKTTRVGTPDEELTTFVYDEPRSGYYNIGSLTSMLDTAGHRYNDYDELGRLARDERSIDAVNYVFIHTYNTAGLPASTTYPDAQTISWTYDVAGNVQTETGTITTASYDAFGRPTSLSFANGVITTYAYSPSRGWIDNIHTATGGIVHQDLTYGHYTDGAISTITSAKSMESWTYVYDDLNRLLLSTNVDTPSLTQSFTYDDVGNMTYNSAIGSYAYPTPGTPRPHAVQTAGTRSYVYDGAGRMTSRNGQVITWNGGNKPASIGSVQFTYGGTGERLKKVSGSNTTRYVNGNYEIAPNGTVTKYLVGGKQVGTAFFVNHSDHLGSIQAVTDASGVEVRRQDHTPFGDQHYATGSHAESKGWIGEREEETELVYLNARYYDPEIGRFTAPDPIVRLGQGLNRFSYAWNNPTNLADATGLDPQFQFRSEVGHGCQDNPSHPTCRELEQERREREMEEQQRRREYEEFLRNRSDAGDDLVPDEGGSQYPYYDNWGPPAPPTTGSDDDDGNSGGGAGPTHPPSPTLTYCQKHPSRCTQSNPALQELAAGIVGNTDKSRQIITKAWVFSATTLVAPAVKVLGAAGGLTGLGITAAEALTAKTLLLPAIGQGTVDAAAAYGFELTGHAAARLSGREAAHVSLAMVRTTLRHGSKFLDPKNSSIVHVLRMQGGRYIGVATPLFGSSTLVKTVMTGAKVVKSRFIPIP